MKHIALFAVFVMALAMTGAGCMKRDARPATPDAAVVSEKDAGTKPTDAGARTADAGVPIADAGGRQGSNVYSGAGFRLVYPIGWMMKVESNGEQPGSVVRLVFDTKSIPEELPPEPFFPVMLEKTPETLDQVLRTFPSDAIKVSEVVAGKDVTFVEYHPEFPDTAMKTYVFTQNGATFVLNGFGVEKSIVKQFVEGLEVM